jgi:hypothetical protein
VSTVRAIAAVAAVVVGCGDDAPSIDAGRRDAKPMIDSAAITVCALFPDPGVADCPAAKKYCCFEDDVTSCEATPTSSSCVEHPPAGSQMACDATSGAGCSGATPICCVAGEVGQGTTYCVDHELAGFIWNCAP